jgi:hypothetical protein
MTKSVSSLVVVAMTIVAVCIATPGGSAADSVKGGEVFDRIVARAQQEHWSQLPLQQVMRNVAMELSGTPYVGSTLELSPDEEIPSANFLGLDCVTFFETTLDVSRMLREGGHTSDDFMRQIRLTRYRGGKPGDYSTRLHYTTDWLFDNQAKHVVTIERGTAAFPKHVDFMSTHAQLYPALKAHPDLVAKMQKIEKAINLRNKQLRYVPNADLAKFETTLQTGDIVGIVTDTPGLDISHTGIVIVDDKNVPHFMDASSKAGVNKVVLEPERLSESISSRKHSLGAVFARPIDPAVH